MELLAYIPLGIDAVFGPASRISILGVALPLTPLMVLAGFVLGIVVGATPGLAGPMAMAVCLPILISIFGYGADALLPVLGFLIGIMKGATLGGAVPAILFNIPGTPDAYMTTLDGHPMAKEGKAYQALRIAHLSSVSGDTFSDIVLIVGAAFIAVAVEEWLDLPEKTALLIFSLSFIAAVIGSSVGKGLIAIGLGLFTAFIGTGEEFYPRLTGGTAILAEGIPIAAAILGVLIVGEIFKSLDDIRREGIKPTLAPQRTAGDSGKLSWSLLRRLFPHIGRSALVGTAIGALPGIGSTLAATIGYTLGAKIHARKRPFERPFGKGAPEGVAATEAANSSVSGANLIPTLSLGIPGNTAAVFLILAMDSIGGFNPGPSVFRTSAEINPELVIVFGLFTSMIFANLLNWTIGGVFMRHIGILTRVKKHILLPIVLLLTMTATYIQYTRLSAVVFLLFFGALGYAMRKLDISPLPFVVAFILGNQLEETARQAFAATGGDAFFLFNRPVAAAFMLLSLITIVVMSRQRSREIP
ncbi:tripartite tricarboxylate transporter permease [Thioalkalivibrio sp. HK1]|uniref:tripartite tricarboxylate transporter permease n=1 Tax=Thioalkalivibrio sp. HK1 TaxID=1469245 RepID=UPI00047284F0|nr:tripartite tricarboxylate transporter permease [Thioalkalivibrio sp. HK1]